MTMNGNNKLDVALARCFYCGKVKVEIEDGKHVKKHEQTAKTIDLIPCSRCRKWMEQGVILLTIDTARSKPNWDNTGKFPDPFRTGGYFVMKDSWVISNLESEVAKVALENRWMYIQHEAAVALGLIKGEDYEGKESV